MRIVLPYNYKPRKYQLSVLQAIDKGKKRAVIVWHRRSGKDKTSINLVAKKMFERKGLYYYFFPTYAQGKKILWDGMDMEGFKFIDHIPEKIRKRTDNTNMLIEAINGSIFQVIGTDNYDSIVGTNPVGCIFSEYALQDPNAWGYIRPILAENNGWALFCFTPRGLNHGHDIYQLAQNDPHNWFSEVLTVGATKAISKKVLEQEKVEITRLYGDEALYLQEYYCSFNVPISGAYYAKQLMAAEEEKRISNVPYDPGIGVSTYWDLGIGDVTAIWFVQAVSKEIRLIDYYETSGEGLQHYVKVLQNKQYVYDRYVAPHDIEVRELGTGKSRYEVARELGIDFDIAPKLSVDEGVDATRRILTQCWFDKKKCERGLNALKNYRKDYDEKNKTFKDKPMHDWSSHAADALRYFAVSYRKTEPEELPPDDTKMFTKNGFY